MGLSLAYAGTQREEFMENIVPLILDTSLRPEVNGMAGLCMGLVFLGTRQEEVGNAVLQNLMEDG